MPNTAMEELREDILTSVLLSTQTKTIVCAFIDNHLGKEKEQLISMCSIGSRNPGIEGEEVFKTAFRKIKSNEQ